MSLYRNIKLFYNDEEWRKQRLIKVVDELYNLIPYDYIIMIMTLKDIKGELNIHWKEAPSNFYKMIINSMWQDLYEFHTNHIILEDDDDNCPCCKAPINKECQEIKDYLKSLNYII